MKRLTFGTRHRVGFAFLALSALSLIVIVLAESSAVNPNTHAIVLAGFGCTILFLALGIFAGLSGFLENVKR